MYPQEKGQEEKHNKEVYVLFRVEKHTCLKEVKDIDETTSIGSSFHIARGFMLK